MRKSIISLLLVLPFLIGAGYKIGPYSTKIPSREVVTNVVVTVVTNDVPLTCLFWLEWIVETNDTPTHACMEKFPNNDWFSATNGFITNYIGIICMTNLWAMPGYTPPCEKEHFDATENQEVKYIQSNLVSFLVWRGRTNVNYLESVPVTNIVRKGHLEKKQVWTQ
jgi:hypothetical protein